MDVIRFTSRFYSLRERADPEGVTEIVQYLLDCDPNVKLQKVQGMSLLHFACNRRRGYDVHRGSNLEADIRIVEVIYDAHPEAIEVIRAIDVQHFKKQVRPFINMGRAFARQANERHRVARPNGNGQFPLHRTLQNNVRLGSIKLLIKGYPPALHSPDKSGALPLHIACQHHNSANVVQYLVGLDTTTLSAVDWEGNSALHYACRGAKYQTIAMLLDKFDAVSVSKRNAQKKLPIDLL